MRKAFTHIVSICTLACLLAACSTTRKLPPGEALYTGADVKIEGPSLRNKERKNIRSELESLTRPVPNK